MIGYFGDCEIARGSSQAIRQVISLKKIKKSLSQRYQRELGVRLRGTGRMSSRAAERLGTDAISLGLETLDLARIHSHSLLAVMPDGCSNAVRASTVKRAGLFFRDTLVPIERTRRAMLDSVEDLRRSNDSLLRRTAELTLLNTTLKDEVAQRARAERMLRRSEKNHRVLLAEARNMQRRLRHLSHQVLLAQEAERKEISRELHDEIVQTLTGINVQLATLKIESGLSKKSFSRHISNTQRLVEKSVEIVHQFARDLRPVLLDDLGLIPAMHAYLKAFTQRTGLQVKFSTFAGIEKLKNDKRVVLYRVAQAALVNVAQHAKAQTVELSFKLLSRSVAMAIKDDGRSFDAVGVMESRRNKRLGLIGMRERVEMVGGTFEIRSAPGRGTEITVTLPYQHTGNK